MNKHCTLVSMSQGPLRQNTPGECATKSSKGRQRRESLLGGVADGGKKRQQTGTNPFRVTFLVALSLVHSSHSRPKERVENTRSSMFDKKSFIFTCARIEDYLLEKEINISITILVESRWRSYLHTRIIISGSHLVFTKCIFS